MRNTEGVETDSRRAGNLPERTGRPANRAARTSTADTRSAWSRRGRGQRHYATQKTYGRKPARHEPTTGVQQPGQGQNGREHEGTRRPRRQRLTDGKATRTGRKQQEHAPPRGPASEHERTGKPQRVAVSNRSNRRSGFEVLRGRKRETESSGAAHAQASSHAVQLKGESRVFGRENRVDRLADTDGTQLGQPLPIPVPIRKQIDKRGSITSKLRPHQEQGGHNQASTRNERQDRRTQERGHEQKQGPDKDDERVKASATQQRTPDLGEITRGENRFSIEMPDGSNGHTRRTRAAGRQRRRGHAQQVTEPWTTKQKPQRVAVLQNNRHRVKTAPSGSESRKAGGYPTRERRRKPQRVAVLVDGRDKTKPMLQQPRTTASVSATGRGHARAPNRNAGE